MDSLLDLSNRLDQPRLRLSYSISDGYLHNVIEEDERQEPEGEEEEEVGEEECVAHGIILSGGRVSVVPGALFCVFSENNRAINNQPFHPRPLRSLGQ